MKHKVLTEAACHQTQGEFAVRFFPVGVAVIGVALGVTWLLLRISPPVVSARLALPPAFAVTTVLLVLVSAVLHFALLQVRVERQRAFRRAMLGALVAGVLFVGVQGYGIAGLLRVGDAASAQTGSLAFVAVFCSLHCLHVSVALLFLVFVTLKSFADRYDHEYYWGVTVCAYFWHGLGVIWLAILCVFAIVV